MIQWFICKMKKQNILMNHNWKKNVVMISIIYSLKMTKNVKTVNQKNQNVKIVKQSKKNHAKTVKKSRNKNLAKIVKKFIKKNPAKTVKKNTKKNHVKTVKKNVKIKKKFVMNVMKINRKNKSNKQPE